MENLIRILVMLIVVGNVVIISIASNHTDDPPKEKKSKKDTVQIDIEQMQQKNLDLDQHNKMLDSLLMKIDTLKKKK
jgi:hypothetical protein